jgi:RNA polymerase sigma-70 factor (ECF subfamily)
MEDALLVQLAREGDEDAVDELFGRIWPLVWHWAYAMTADRTLADHVAQETVYRAFATLDRFDASRPFLPWLKRITVNHAIARRRRGDGGGLGVSR